MTFSNSPGDFEAADRRSHFHSQTNPVAHLADGPFTIVRGEGPYVFDLDGRKYLDAVSSLWCASLGFSDRRLAEAGARALETLPVYHTFNHRANPAVSELSGEIAAMTPIQDSRVFFTNGGSEAVDSMVKMAWYYHSARGEPSRRTIISQTGAFHGSTVMAARLGGLPAMHASFNLPDCHVAYVGRPHFYRDGLDGESESEFSDRLVGELESLIVERGPETIAAFIAEPVMGAGGVIMPPDGYLAKVQAVLRKYGILYLSDEVICGFGRTGQWFGCQSVGVEPDMMSVAKGLSSGYAPIGGVILSGAVFDAIAAEADRNGVFSHGFTYSGHPVTSAIALETLRIYKEMNLPARAAELGHLLGEGLRAVAEHPLVGNVRRLGYLAGVELVAERNGRVPFSPEMKVGAAVERRSREQGLIIRNLGDVIAICPPFITSPEEVDFIVEALSRTLDEVQRDLKQN